MSSKWAQGEIQVLPHYLNPGKIDASIRTNAGLLKPFYPALKPNGGCMVIQCSTGCYYSVCVPLVNGWLGMIGESATRVDGGGLLLQVEGVWGQEDQAGAVQSYMVRLLVEGEALTLHFYNTKHKVNVQGDKMILQKFCNELFIPFFESESMRLAPRIKSLNDQMIEGGRRGEKRTMQPNSSRTKSTPQAKKLIAVQFESDTDVSDGETDVFQIIPQGDQQLSDSLLLHSTHHPPEYLGTPESSPSRQAIVNLPAGGMDRQELPAGGMDFQVELPAGGLELQVKIPAVGLEIQDQDRPLVSYPPAVWEDDRVEKNWSLDLKKSHPKQVLGTMLTQYYRAQESTTPSHDEEDEPTEPNVQDLAQAILENGCSFKCMECSKEFDTEDNLDRHEAIDHKKQTNKQGVVGKEGSQNVAGSHFFQEAGPLLRRQAPLYQMRLALIHARKMNNKDEGWLHLLFLPWQGMGYSRNEDWRLLLFLPRPWRKYGRNEVW